jgi:aminoglycoside phosphotransferase (APT) family kinase protein
VSSPHSPVTDPVPDRLESVLDPQWLTGALADLPHDHQVIEVVQEDSFKTIASKVRFRLVARGPGGGTVHRSYCIKGHFQDDRDSLRSETLFYRHLQPILGVRSPRAHYTGIDDEQGRSLIIMDDVLARGGRFLGAHQPYSVATIKQSLAQLAQLHAATWDQPADGDGWLTPRIRPMIDMYSTDYLHGLLNDGRGRGLPAALLDGHNLKEAVHVVAAARPTNVIHGDAHSGNVYVEPDGQPGWLDWQIVQQGHWATDVSYHLATALSIEDRRASERDLLRHYLSELARAGASHPPDWEEAWERYRCHFPYGYFLWAITRISSREVVLLHIPRIATAMDDHQTLRLLGVA